MGGLKKFVGAAMAAAVLLMLGFAAGQASAAPKKKPYQPIDAKVLIDACWEISKEKREGPDANTGTMRQGSVESIKCLEEEILRNGGILLGKKGMDRATMKGHLDSIRTGVGKLYWTIYNEHKGCKIGACGTIHTLFHLPPIAEIFEKLLKDIVDQRNEYEV